MTTTAQPLPGTPTLHPPDALSLDDCLQALHALHADFPKSLTDEQTHFLRDACALGYNPMCATTHDGFPTKHRNLAVLDDLLVRHGVARVLQPLSVVAHWEAESVWDDVPIIVRVSRRWVALNIWDDCPGEFWCSMQQTRRLKNDETELPNPTDAPGGANILSAYEWLMGYHLGKKPKTPSELRAEEAAAAPPAPPAVAGHKADAKPAAPPPAAKPKGPPATAGHKPAKGRAKAS